MNKSKLRLFYYLDYVKELEKLSLRNVRAFISLDSSLKDFSEFEFLKVDK